MLTIETIATGINKNWSFEDWLRWPPNIFVLTSMIFQRTGCYKVCLIENSKTGWYEHEWQAKITKAAATWQEHAIRTEISALSDENMIPEKGILPYCLFTTGNVAAYDILKKGWDTVNIDDLRTIEQSSIPNNPAVNLAIALVAAHATADMTAKGVGSIGQDTEGSKHLRLYYATCSLLLNNIGSVSTIPKFFGAVVPKMRTPQSGISVRCMSHYLTFHHTEVEVMWRTFPWLNNHKKSLNILAIPCPKDFYIENFQPLEDKDNPTRYFKVHQKDLDVHFIESLVDYIFHQTEGAKVDIVVLPEMALSGKDYNSILVRFNEKYTAVTKGANNIELPIVVSGVLVNEVDNSQTYINELRMAIFFAGRWYQMRQNKHHRWQLDKNQIIQYSMESVLPTEKNWFEHIEVGQRRLSILAPNGWLALTSLICEDLARQEPVTELIRGIGPTVLMALLSDGPQLSNRWSARYASILAEDPGTAVLSLTSRAMAKRSQNMGSKTEKSGYDKGPEVVGLWKDMLRGWKELSIQDEADALLFTISSDYVEEFTLDGRTDFGFASVFRMDSFNPIQVKFTKKPEPADPGSVLSKATTDKLFRGWDDIRELSALVYAIDAIIDLMISGLEEKVKEQYVEVLLSYFTTPQKEEKSGTSSNICEQIQSSWKDPQSIGIQANSHRSDDRGSDMDHCITEIKILIKEIRDGASKTRIEYYAQIISQCKKQLEALQKHNRDRIDKVPYMIFIFVINTKLLNFKSRTKSKPNSNFKWHDVLSLKSEINSVLNEHLPQTVID